MEARAPSSRALGCGVPSKRGEVMSHDDLLTRHRQVLPAWLVLYYDELIELVSGKGR